ncbi:MAG: thiamine-phosphate kinase [Armatimonadetes bacterium]|nr:thiamine-phosphate kinase [Armatimonadota bacterium]
MNLSEIGEFGLIAHLQKGLETRAGVQIGIGDDAAVLESLQRPIVTMDALVEGVHFRRDWTTPRALGRKAMAVNVSDLAASGARPVAAFVSLALGADEMVEWIEELYAGFEDAAREWGFSVAGGDMTRSRGDVMISVALVGEVLNLARGPILRSGARNGDVLVVSGTLGDAAAGLALLQTPDIAVSDATRQKMLLRHHEPTPRLHLMSALLEIDADAVHGALDLSDGLAGDAVHLARRSGVSPQIETGWLPISPQCREVAAALNTDALDWALAGGEDYELLLALAPEGVETLLLETEKRCGVPLAIIGKCGAQGEAGPRVRILENGATRQTTRPWTHF